MTYDELKTEFLRRVNLLKITDMTALNHKCAEILGKIVSENVFEIDDISGACKKILREYYEIMNKTNARLQKEIDQKIGLQIAAQKADFPAERVAKVAKALTDPTVSPETIQRRARNAVENVANSFHDDYVKANAKFRSKAGIKCYIVRETDGNCCKWCSSLAGRYVYGDEPDDVYHRHDNCTCTTTFENGRERQDVWSKKKWRVTPILKIPYEPLVLDKNQAQNLQNIQFAKYKGLDKSTVEIYDSINNTGQNEKQNDRKDSYKNSENNLTSTENDDKIKNIESSDNSSEFYFDEYQEKYEEYLKNVPVEHKKALKYAADNCDNFEVNDNKIIYAYDANLDTLFYNPQHKNFKFYDFNTTYTHELSHYLDNHFFKSFEDSQFSKSISENSYSNQYIKDCIEKSNINLNKELELSDIISALTLNKFKVQYGHETKYWEKEQGHHREKEIFVNLFNLEAQKNETVINFVKLFFPDVWDSYSKVRDNGLSKIIKKEEKK